MCSGCKVLQNPFFFVDQSQVPDVSQRETASSLLDKARGLSVQQTMLRLTSFFSENSLPYGFRSSRGSTGFVAQYVAGEWSSALDYFRRHGHMPSGTFPLPGGLLSVDHAGNMSIEGISIKGQLPMLDICEWLSNPERVGAIRSWPNFLLAMSCCCVKLARLDDDSWAPWLRSNGWQAIDVPNPSIEMRLRGTNLHPFLRLTGLLSVRNPNSEKSLGSIARDAIRQNQCLGGEASKAWTEIIKKGAVSEFGRLFSVRIHPRLVVEEGRLRLIVLRSGTPSTIPVVLDARVWRTLVHSLLFPEGHEGANLAKHIFWIWESQEAEWRPSLPQERSARFLREIIGALGDNSSEYPVTHLESRPGIRVTGESGMVYIITSSEIPSKFFVYAIPNVIHIGSSISSIHLCIDPNQVSASKNLSSGDICASYVLALRNDISSRNQIFTLDVLLSACEHVNENYDLSDDLDTWWATVEGHYEMWGQEEFDEQDFDPEFEPERVPEPEPEPEPESEPTGDRIIRWSAESIEELIENMELFPMGEEVSE